jgi:hypothetical protein
MIMGSTIIDLSGDEPEVIRGKEAWIFFRLVYR